MKGVGGKVYGGVCLSSLEVGGGHTMMKFLNVGHQGSCQNTALLSPGSTGIECEGKAEMIRPGVRVREIYLQICRGVYG